MSARKILAAASVVVALACPASASADELFSPDRPEAGFSADLAAGAERFVFVTLGADGRGRLREGFGDRARPLPVRPARFIGGLDVGTDSRGREAAVYARCGSSESDPCDLYLFSFTSRRERRLSFSRGPCREVSPRIDRGVVVFFRRRADPAGEREPAPEGSSRSGRVGG